MTVIRFTRLLLIHFERLTALSPKLLDLLMNHTVPGVNAGHITRNKLLGDHLRQQQELISRKISPGDLPGLSFR
jgi:hypothetical protein